MTFKQKREINKHEHLRFLHPYYKDEDIKRFAPAQYESLPAALKALDKEISKTARINGFYKKEVLKAGYDHVIEEVKKLWTEE